MLPLFLYSDTGGVLVSRESRSLAKGNSHGCNGKLPRTTVVVKRALPSRDKAGSRPTSSYRDTPMESNLSESKESLEALDHDASQRRRGGPRMS